MLNLPRLLGLAWVSLLSLATAQVAPAPAMPAPVISHPGVVTTPGGGMCTGTFDYDSQNGAPACFISQQCATDAGLGVGGPGGFTPPAGTPCATVNNPPIPVWVFPCCTVAATDSKGTVCFCKSTIYVTKTAGGTLDTNLLSNTWGRCVGVRVQEGEGVYWPTVSSTVIAQAQAISMSAGESEEYGFQISISAPGMPPSGRMARYASLSGFHFVHPNLISELGLSASGFIDLQIADPESLRVLSRLGMNVSGRTSFSWVSLPSVDLGLSDPRPMGAFVLDSSDEDVVLLGGRDAQFFADVSFVSDVGPGGSLMRGIPAEPPIDPLAMPFHLTPAAITPGNGFRIEPALPPEGFVEGATLISFDTSAPYGGGPLIGVTPDAVTHFTLALPPALDNPFHFIGSHPTLYPHQALEFPPGILPVGISLDLAMIYLTPSGVPRFTAATRLTTH